MSGPATRTRFRRGRLILAMLDDASGAAADRWREEREALWTLAQEALPYVVSRAVEMPMVHGLDVGPRIVYDRPPPYEHTLEYVQAAANGYSFDDPRGWYEAEQGGRPFERIRGYEVAVREFCERWQLIEPWAQRMIVHGHLAAVAAGDRAESDRALDALAGSDARHASDLRPEVDAILEAAP